MPMLTVPVPILKRFDAIPENEPLKPFRFSSCRFYQSLGYHFGLGKQGFVTAFDLDQVKFPKALGHPQKGAGRERGVTEDRGPEKLNKPGFRPSPE
jgi:hypothetical protein